MKVSGDRVLVGTLDRAVIRLRRLPAGVAIERWRLRTGALARLFGRRPEVVTRWVRRAGELRVEVAGFREALESSTGSTASPTTR